MNYIAAVLPLGIWLGLIALVQSLIRRLGYSKSHALAFAFVALIPVANIFLLFYFFWTEWPIEKSQREARLKRGEATTEDLKALLAAANQSEALLDIPGAMRGYQRVLELTPPDGPEAAEAQKMLAMLAREYPQHQPSNENILPS